jgi:hypothetical protein
MKKSTKIIASIAATFVIIASIATVSLFKTDDSQVVPTTTLIVSTTLLPTQPLETVSAFDWEAYLNSQELSSETELSTEDPTATTIPVAPTSPNIIISYVYPEDYVPQTLPTKTTTTEPSTQANRVEMVDYQYKVDKENEEVTLTKYIGSDMTPSIPETVAGYNVTTIGSACFKGTKITSVYIPKTVTKIATAAFNNCQSLKSVYFLGTNYVDIGESVFENCISLSSISMSANTTAIGANAFANCTSLKKIKIPESVTVIGQNAFAGCSKDLTIVCKSGTIAETVALAYEFKIELE